MSKRSKGYQGPYLMEDICPPFDIDAALEELEFRMKLYNKQENSHRT